MDENLSNITRLDGIVIVSCVLNAPLTLLSTTGNALVLVAILRTPSLRSPSIIFLCSLAFSDLFVGLVVQPFYIADELKSSRSLFLARQTLSFLACGVSLTTMTAISVDRILALGCHLRYPSLMTIKRAIYTSSVLWCNSIIFSCFSFWNSNIYYLTITVGIAICLFVSTYSYIRIYFIVRRHQLQIHSQQQAVQSLNKFEDNLNMARSKKSAINTFIYYICMILCYLPVLISMLVLAVFPNRWTKVWILADTVAFMNSSINPILYCWRTRELRTAVLKTLRNIVFKQT